MHLDGKGYPSSWKRAAEHMERAISLGNQNAVGNLKQLKSNDLWNARAVLLNEKLGSFYEVWGKIQAKWKRWPNEKTQFVLDGPEILEPIAKMRAMEATAQYGVVKDIHSDPTEGAAAVNLYSYTAELDSGKQVLVEHGAGRLVPTSAWDMTCALMKPVYASLEAQCRAQGIPWLLGSEWKPAS